MRQFPMLMVLEQIDLSQIHSIISCQEKLIRAREWRPRSDNCQIILLEVAKLVNEELTIVTEATEFVQLG